MNIIQGSYGWLKRNTCWSMDTMMVRFMGGWLYVMLLVEETSRLILSCKIAEQKLGKYAQELLLTTISQMSIKPLVVKHDRGVEFENKDFQDALRDERIISLPSPGHYAPFNSIVERTIRLVRKFTMPLEMGCDAGLEEIEKAMCRAQRDINHELPRKIFDGRTSQEIYESTSDYEEYEREHLIETIYENQEIKEGKYFLSGKALDRLREKVVEYLCQRKLCYVEYHIKKVRLKITA